jgi:hypothetical protein
MLVKPFDPLERLACVEAAIFAAWPAPYLQVRLEYACILPRRRSAG